MAIKVFSAVVLAALCVGAMGSLFQPNHYPNIVPGFTNHIYGYQPSIGQFNCLNYWCRSTFTRQYYCCTTPQQQALANQQIAGHIGGAGVLPVVGAYNPYNPLGAGIHG